MKVTIIELDQPVYDKITGLKDRALRKVKRTSFKCDGIEMYLNHRGPVDKIQIKKAK